MRPLRSYIILATILGAYAVLGFKLYDLQIAKRDFYEAKAESQYRLAGFLEPHRGIISVTDKNNAVIPVAVNTSHSVIIAVPREIKDIDRAVENVSPILDMEAEKLREILSKKSAYHVLLKDPTPEQITQITEVGIVGVRVDEQEGRTYSFCRLASQVIGFVGPSGEDDVVQGRYGIEKQFEKLLAGTPGSILNADVELPIQGKDIATTVDRTIQAHAETLLKNLVEKHSADGGTIIVQDPKTGKVRAMTNMPDFNPNDYSKSPLNTFTNPAVQGRYEPGSVFKILTAAIGLDTQAFTPQTTYYDSGSLRFPDGKVIKNWDLKGHGTITMTNVIEQSINTGAAFMESKIGHTKFYHYLSNFGFNEPTGIALPGEVGGSLKNIKTRNSDIDFAAASFGQGVAVTPIQLITAISAIANGGTLMKPYIMQNEEPEEVRRVLSTKAARETTKMMISAVRKAQIAQIPNFTVAGKTGTAQAVDFVHGGYTKDVINTYVGFVPALDPQFIILIKLDRPAGAPLAGITVVPAFRTLAEFIINYENILPDALP